MPNRNKFILTILMFLAGAIIMPLITDSIPIPTILTCQEVDIIMVGLMPHHPITAALVSAGPRVRWENRVPVPAPLRAVGLPGVDRRRVLTVQASVPNWHSHETNIFETSF
jgi:hypothetical protein